MIVVADTSPLNYLVVIGHIDMLPALFARVLTPPAVLHEMMHPAAPSAVRAWASAPPAWLDVRAPRAAAAVSRLGPGESSAIAVAEEVRTVDTDLRIRMDDRAGCNEALRRGFVVIGTLAVLEAAAVKGLLEFRAAVDRLRRTSFHMSEATVAEALVRLARGGHRP
jgi:predicted nucleic acid-binding protein